MADQQDPTEIDGPSGAAMPEASPDEIDNSDPVLTAMRSHFEAARAEAAAHLDSLTRMSADFANYRRRASAELAGAQAGADDALLGRLLDILDDFDRANAARPADEPETAWAAGWAAIERKFRLALDAEGISKMEAAGEVFDPRRHEAIGTTVAPAESEGSVVAVIRPGYLRGERVLRPASVMVGITGYTSEQRANG